ncbi:hypothetical protein [Bacteroides stercorirosoris]|uniref:hypothetical protein n=1 Tax=Bacteroides stercorirosoris TaxID=871324 RepID=UPI0011149C77|nr:hypothetical protein [Bacteroides stercorirosoris]
MGTRVSYYGNDSFLPWKRECPFMGTAVSLHGNRSVPSWEPQYPLVDDMDCSSLVYQQEKAG